ncbi:MerR family transcriptional regulator [Anaerocolumna cellulosilytica]|uniref:MerR family transcriptional regulator n=1 Tax=Anaerocolumna cellulosilytica TaxID=433286 RepID=A0A6S6R0V7_9FIRM|nr:MerR family transcriptional regulator [Anaerocolumna cellulosilytica]MBB5196003.1 DNA-binding transcriptional MerR regulator [Anaerocolumna cellulosilytica]BCJ93697.1 MerR family transcriptional regulator [Anaerocolumna cellulosilytica]
MKISEVCKVSGLTRKAVEYYIDHGLVTPEMDDSGYREFSQKDSERLKQVSVLRMLGVTVTEIKRILKASQPIEELRRCVLKRQVDYTAQEQQIKLLERLADGESVYDIEQEIQNLNDTKAIKLKLLEAFPGYIGRLYLVHFAPFLEEPLSTMEQKAALEAVINFLDNIKVPEHLRKCMDELQEDINFGSNEHIASMEKVKLQEIDNMEQFMQEKREFLQTYQEFKASEAYTSSLAGQFAKALKEFNNTNGYNEVFIPAMRTLSPKYDAYCRKLEKANRILLKQYPEYQQ